MLSTPSTTNTTSLTSASSTMSRQRPQRAPFITWTLLLMLPIALCALASPAVGQVLYGSIVGNVVDETRGTLPGATVTIVHNESGQSRETVTDSTGAYRFTAVQPGTYTVTVKLDGLPAVHPPGCGRSRSTASRASTCRCRSGQLSETVTVSAERPLLQTDRAEVRSELKASELVNLPVSLNRNYQYLFRVLPGLHAAGGGALGSVEPVARARLQRQRREPQLEQHPHRRRQHDQHLAAARRGLRACARIARDRQRRHQQLRRGAGAGRRIGHQRADQERHEQLPRLGVRVPTRTSSCGRRTTSRRPARRRETGSTTSTAARSAARSSTTSCSTSAATRARATSRSLTRTLSVPTAALRRGDLSALVDADLRPVHRQPERLGPHRVCGQHHSRPIASTRLRDSCSRSCRCRTSPRTAETNNYFVQAPFVLNRWTLDTQGQLERHDEAEHLRAVQRARLLHRERDQLRQGAAGTRRSAAATRAPASGNTYNVSAGATYTLTPTLVMDAHVGFVRMNTGVEQSDIGENKGLDFLGLPGTNGPNAYEGGTPLFDLDTYADLGTTDTFMPYYRSDDQYQAVVNVNWIKGRHNVRFGTDIYYQALNHTQPEISGGDSFGARGGFRYQSGPTQIQGGPGGNLYNAFASFLLGVPNRIGRLKLVEPYTTRNWQYSLYVRDQWQASSRMTVSYGTRWEYFPVPTRADRGLERYNVEHQPDDDRRRRIGAEGSRESRSARRCSRRASA